MTELEVTDRLASVFHDVFDDDSLSISSTTTAKDIEGWDSLTHVTLVVAVENAFGVKFTTKEISGLANVGDFIRLIARKTGASA